MSTSYSQLKIFGNAVTIRPIQPADAEMEAEFVRRLSPQSRRYRFLGGIKSLTPELLKAFCDVDGRQSMALVATVREHDQNSQEIQIGVSRYAPDSGADRREMAVTVADDWQHRGIGKLLAERLIEYARAHGVKELYSVDLADNTHMRELADDLDMNVRPDPDDMHQVIYSLML